MSRRSKQAEAMDRDAERIVEEFRRGETISGAMKKYYVGYAVVKEFISRHFTEAEWSVMRRRNNGRGNIASHFEPGHVPWNKGKKGWCPPGVEKTQFKPGCIRGQAARRYRAIGSISIRYDKPPRSKRNRVGRKKKDGSTPRGNPRRWIKVRDDGPTWARCIPYATYRYEKRYGPIPPNHFVIHADGDTLNDTLENLLLVDRSENLKRLQSNPAVQKNRRKKASKATMKRHALNRAIRAFQKQQATEALVSWMCKYCGASYDGLPEQCIKCGRAGFEKVFRPVRRVG